MSNLSQANRGYNAIASMKGHGAAATEENRHFQICIMGNGVFLEDKQVKCKLKIKHVKTISHNTFSLLSFCCASS